MKTTAKVRRDRTKYTLKMLEEEIAHGGLEEHRHARTVIKAAKKFAKCWREWHATPDAMPDPDTIEAAWRLAELLGIEDTDG